jgi:serine protease Do
VKATLEALPSKTTARITDMPADERAAGLVVEPLTPQRARQMGLSDNSGLLVTGVNPDGPAAEAGIRTGDVIRQVDGHTLSSADELRRALSGGDRPALVLVRRGDQSMFVPLPRLG